jgi:hypothetical protein
MSEETPTPPSTSEPIVAHAGTYYRNTRYLMAILLVGMGLWFGYDGFVNWPQQNEIYNRLDRQRLADMSRGDNTVAAMVLEQMNQYKHHSDTDIGMQKVLCVALPILGIVVLIRALYNSRGEYRLEENTLHIPGHRPVPLGNVSEIDRRLWDRKGIAYIRYELNDGKAGKIRLDDFVYDRPPTDEIFKRVEQHLNPNPPPERAPPVDQTNVL